ncbi:PDZ domain-containing protein [Oikeobacillus pervagus]|uniref:endopeptidase La n=1 Tax=Oikeobacillus pervagus TaxID=1325931 RepID=A0AAJ1WJ95_9BACI|nr:SepM family pheromone-processing serine protease [Oikeobacillus pervagus]MDQ0215223.1 PDZ domain-containing protein [Oikeobacillus pervagus]
MKNKKLLPVIFLIFALVIGSSFFTLPYYVTKPGLAHELKPIVQVEGGDEDEGQLMLTTVRMGRANIYSYALASLKKYEEIIPVEEVHSPHETDEEYNVRQMYMMDNSKYNAIMVAFDFAKKPYHFDYKGVYVLNVFQGMPAAKILKAGDRIVGVDGKVFQSSKQFTQYVADKKLGDKIHLTYFRDQEKKEADVYIDQFKSHPERVGIGIGLVDDRKIISDPKVGLNTSEIGGPSAGLMFSLEIYNQLVKEDITKGKKIAGTGTISADGIVGRIGGIQQKVVAADQAGAEIFLAPHDEIPPDLQKKYPDMKSNYEEALIAAKDIHTKMKIIPIKTFQEALDYLQTL